jgi:hypothetical protein
LYLILSAYGVVSLGGAGTTIPHPALDMTGTGMDS